MPDLDYDPEIVYCDEGAVRLIPRDARPPGGRSLAAHDVKIGGVWFNTGEAGVNVWCYTCEAEVLDGEPFGDRLTVPQIIGAVLRHMGKDDLTDAGGGALDAAQGAIGLLK